MGSSIYCKRLCLKKQIVLFTTRIFPSLDTYSVATKENGKNGKVSWRGNQKSDCGSFLLLIELVLEFPIFGVTSFCTRV